MSKEWNDLINYGIKDKHYLVNADGTYKLPDGVDYTNNPYGNVATFFFGNQFLSGVMAPDAPDLRAKVLELDKKAVASQFLGYTFDGASVMSEIAAVNNKVTEYYLSLTCGNVDPAVALPKFLKEMDDAGYAKIIAENQKQLDAWLAAK
jgi:putative aldouronate transport system substrate-binding protein